jgi:hypothetical protein
MLNSDVGPGLMDSFVGTGAGGCVANGPNSKLSKGAPSSGADGCEGRDTGRDADTGSAFHTQSRLSGACKPSFLNRRPLQQPCEAHSRGNKVTPTYHAKASIAQPLTATERDALSRGGTRVAEKATAVAAVVPAAQKAKR